MTKRAVVLGCGLVGATMARDLASDGEIEVTVADVSLENLKKLESLKAIQTVQADLSDVVSVQAMVKDFDVVVGGLPSRIGFQTLRAVIEAGKPYCDITFMPDDALQLDGLAKKHKVTAIVDCGVSPGLSNLAIGHAYKMLDRTDRASIFVGGLPKVRHWPYHYKAPFAPSDVIEEYTRPARIVENGMVVVKPALSEPELLDFPRAGTLEAFNTDGLRSLIETVKIPNMKEKTLRYPGHCELMRILRETGFFNKEELDVNGVKVRPLDVTAKLMFPKWSHDSGEEEFTLLRVTVEGVKDSKPVRYTYDLYDEYDAATNTSSMARTTGFPNVIMARMVARGEFTEPGVFPPELLARHEGIYDRMIAELAARGVKLEMRVEELG